MTVKVLIEKLLTFLGLSHSPRSDWQLIDDARPEIGDLIACCAPAATEGVIYWSGVVIEKNGPWDIMRTGAKGHDEEREFIITYDTLWLKIPKPNVIVEDSLLPERSCRDCGCELYDSWPYPDCSPCVYKKMGEAGGECPKEMPDPGKYE